MFSAQFLGSRNPRLWISGSLLVLSASCGDDASGKVSEADVIERYVEVVRATYGDTLIGAQDLSQSIDKLIDDPSQASLEQARRAWRAAREPYGQSEAFRFYEGPIDDPKTGPEGRINGWPLDEVFIDYVTEEPDAGMINQPKLFPKLTKQLIAEQNERGGEKNISSGYHAIEFLLWGQDRDLKGPGDRPYSDYVTGADARNAERRAQYLRLTAELLVEDLSEVSAAWSEAEDSYANKLIALEPDEAIRRMLKGLSGLAGKELSGERMTVAYTSGDQEDEHSCFSDNTLRDYITNVEGLENVYLGRYGDEDGPGLDDLVANVDEELDATMKASLNAALDAMQAIPAPLDQTLASPDGSPGRKKMKAAIDAVKRVNETIAKIAQTLAR